MQQDYIPKAVNEGKFEGKLTLKLLSFDERFELVEKAQAAAEKGISNTTFMVGLVREFKPRFVAVDLIRLKDGARFKSYDELQYGTDCHGILIDAATWLLSGDEEKEKPSGS